MEKDKNTIKFIEKAKQIHGDKYDYSKVEYVNATTRVCIICHEHGEFWQTPHVHLRGSNCPKCALKTIAEKNTSKNFVSKAKEIHGDKYDYSKVEYIDNKTNVTIICPIHGEFKQTAQVHLKGGGCPKCARDKAKKGMEKFVEESNLVHNNKYDYSKVEYVNAHTNVIVTCPIHGDFTVRPCNHLHGNGCPECKKDKISNFKRKPLEQFVEESNLIHNNKYDYSKTSYITTDDAIIISCPIHGEFKQRPHDHLRGHGCPKCANQQSLVEDEIYNYISQKKCDVKRRVTDLLDGKKEIDIYIPSKNVGIEYNGLHWHSEEFGKDRMYHLNKTEEANKNGIKLLQLFEDEWEEKKDIVLSKISHIISINNELPKIVGRKTIVCEVPKESAKEFLEKNHIQGYASSTLCIGAFWNDKLIGVTTFIEESERHWNLNRMATDISYNCIGVCGKMLEYFKRNYIWENIKTFADRRWTVDSENNLYTKLGFKMTKTLIPDYRYIVGKKRVHKFNFRKKNIIKKYNVDENMTEKEMMNSLKIYKIWDCGLYKYEMFNIYNGNYIELDPNK